ncbi:MAG: CZB domain-containing protein [Magnetococcales bacterium]|nr:CZB domain-containing protein [Magnetococcales bacterium]
MANRLDINIARVVHLNWELSLEALISGGRKEVWLPNHENCDLGVWLHGSGLAQPGGFDAAIQLVEVHRQFHEVAERLSSGFHSQGREVAEKELEKVRNLSREILFLLTSLELDHLGSHGVVHSIAQPVKNILGRLFGGSDEYELVDAGVLAVNRSRLVHLQWLRNMDRAFRHRGRNVALVSAEGCPLGVWIHTVGLKRYGQFDEIKHLNDCHKAFHDRAREAIAALRHRRDAQAEKAYKEVQQLSREIIHLLSVVDFKLLDSESMVSAGPFLD